MSGEDDQARALKHGRESAQHVFPISIRQLALTKNHRQPSLTQLGQRLSVSTGHVELPVCLSESTLKKREIFDGGTDYQAAQPNRAFKRPIAGAVNKAPGRRHS